LEFYENSADWFPTPSDDGVEELFCPSFHPLDLAELVLTTFSYFWLKENTLRGVILECIADRRKKVTTKPSLQNVLL